MSDRIVRIDVRTLDNLNDEQLEKLELLLTMVSNTETGIDLVDESETHERDHALEAKVIEDSIDALQKDNAEENQADVLESLTQQDASWRRHRREKLSALETLRGFGAWCEKNKIPVIGKLLIGLLS